MNEMGKACSTYRGEERCIQVGKQRDNLEDLGVDGGKYRNESSKYEMGGRGFD
jgi:hypothetical protein